MYLREAVSPSEIRNSSSVHLLTNSYITETPLHVPHDGVQTPTSQAGVLSLGVGVEVGVCIAVRTTDNSQGDGQISEND